MPIIEIHNLRFSWPGEESLQLEIDSFSLLKGEKLFLKGPSGSGKSTLLGLITGINTARSGTVSVVGQPLSDLGASKKDAFRADNIGYIFQQFNLLPYLSVLDNVTLPCRFSKQRRKKAGADLNKEASRLLQRLRLPKNCLEKPVTELSIGQQQRVAAARALIGKPALVVADEPTSALDYDSRNAFIRLLMDECDNAGSGLLFVSHDHTLEPLFDRVVSLTHINKCSGKQSGDAY